LGNTSQGDSYRKKDKTESNSLSADDTKLVQISEQFNNFFCTIGENLAKKISTQKNNQFKKY